MSGEVDLWYDGDVALCCVGYDFFDLFLGVVAAVGFGSGVVGGGEDLVFASPGSFLC